MFTNQCLVLSNWPTKFKISVEREQQLPFPAVTICNLNLHRKSILEQNPVLHEVLKQFIGEKGFLHGQSFQGDHEESEVHTVNLENQMSRMNLNLSFEAKKATHQSEDMFINCEFDQQYWDCDEVFTPTLVDGHHCYTFNSEYYLTNHSRFYTQTAGSKSGLRLYLNSELQEYDFADEPGGFRVLFIYAIKPICYLFVQNFVVKSIKI